MLKMQTKFSLNWAKTTNFLTNSFLQYHQKLGILGELLVKKFLLEQNTLFLAHSLYYHKEGEIDLLFCDTKDKLLYLIEVKTRLFQNEKKFLEQNDFSNYRVKQKLAYTRIYSRYHKLWEKKWSQISNMQPIFLYANVSLVENNRSNFLTEIVINEF